MSKKLKILFHVPKVHSYRAPVLLNLSKLVKILPITDSFNKSLLNKSDIVNLSKLNNEKKGLSFLKGNNKLEIILKTIFLEYDVFFCSLHVNRFDLLLAGLISRLRGKYFIIHSHCLYKKYKNQSFIEYYLKILIHYLWFKISSRTISYGEKSRRYFYLTQNVLILENRFEKLPINNKKFNKPYKSLLSNKPIKILFLGRILSEESVNLLVNINFLLKKKYGIFVEFNIIGQKVNNPTNSIFINHGSIRDYKKIQEISNNCLFGIHPNNCGLTLVHYMSLGIIPVVHNKIYLHGPEVINNCSKKNTIFYNEMDPEDCSYRLYKVITNPKLFKQMRLNSIIRSKNLHAKPFSKELYEHILFVSNQ